MIQLAHVAGPRMPAQRFGCFVVEAVNFAMVTILVLQQKIFRQGLDVFAAIAQGGQINLNGVQAK